jgi:hypothetical protein
MTKERENATEPEPRPIEQSQSGARSTWAVLKGVAQTIALATVLVTWGETRLSQWTFRVAGQLQPGMLLTPKLLSEARGILQGHSGKYDADYRRRYDWKELIKSYPSEIAARDWVPAVDFEPGTAIPIALAAAFPLLASPVSPTSLAAIQFGVDLLVLLGVFWLGSRVAGSAFGGWVAAFLYAVSASAAEAAAFPFYYYWMIPAGTAVAVCALRAFESAPRIVWPWVILTGVVAGLSVLFRVALLVLPIALVPALILGFGWKKGLVTLAIIIGTAQLVLVPNTLRLFLATGRVQVFQRSLFWHNMYIGLGSRPNPYGIQFRDADGFAVAQQKYGVAYDEDNVGPYEKALRAEYLRIAAENPGLIVRNFVWNSAEAMRGSPWAQDRLKLDRRLRPLIPILLILAITVYREKLIPTVALLSFLLMMILSVTVVCWPQPSYMSGTCPYVSVLEGAAVAVTLRWIASVGDRAIGGRAHRRVGTPA